MAFTGKENHSISSTDAERLKNNFTKSNPNQIKAYFFGRDLIDNILKQDGCVGIRIYYAQKDDGTPTLVLFGADKDQKDIIALGGEYGMPCPPHCP